MTVVSVITGIIMGNSAVALVVTINFWYYGLDKIWSNYLNEKLIDSKNLIQ